MSFVTVRQTLFTVHMWVGLVLGLFLAALGLSGSVLVYDDAIGNLRSIHGRVAPNRDEEMLGHDALTHTSPPT